MTHEELQLTIGGILALFAGGFFFLGGSLAIGAVEKGSEGAGIGAGVCFGCCLSLLVFMVWVCGLMSTH